MDGSPVKAKSSRGEPMPPLRSDEEAERFVETADLSEYDLSGFQSMRFVVDAGRGKGRKRVKGESGKAMKPWCR